MRIIDWTPTESSVFFTPGKKDFIHLKFPQKPIRHYIAIVIAVLEFEGIYGGYQWENNHKSWFFIDADTEWA